MPNKLESLARVDNVPALFMVWDAPNFLHVKYTFAIASRYRDSSRLEYLFNTILEIHNAG